MGQRNANDDEVFLRMRNCQPAASYRDRWRTEVNAGQVSVRADPYYEEKITHLKEFLN